MFFPDHQIILFSRRLQIIACYQLFLLEFSFYAQQMWDFWDCVAIPFACEVSKAGRCCQLPLET